MQKFACIFDEIDNPTEKERAEIRKINADTDSVYINAGVVSPEEIRSVLRADEKSGYTALGEEMEGEPAEEENDPFADIEGGSSTEQSPFNIEDKWEESKHPRKKNGQFGSGGSSESNTDKNKSERHNRVKNRQRKPLKLSKYESAVLRDSVARNQFNDEEKQVGYATRNTSQYHYWLRIDNAELLSYTPLQRWKIK